MAKKWNDVRRKGTRQEEAEDAAWVAEQVLEMNLRALREMSGKTQQDVAAVLEMTQGQLSRIEKRDDHLVSTLRSVVEALGGELEVVARFDNKTVRLTGV